MAAKQAQALQSQSVHPAAVPPPAKPATQPPPIQHNIPPHQPPQGYPPQSYQVPQPQQVTHKAANSFSTGMNAGAGFSIGCCCGIPMLIFFIITAFSVMASIGAKMGTPTP